LKVVVIKYNAGNIHSVRLALQRLGLDPKVSDSPDEIFAADKVIFPGVGEASSAMEYLKQKSLDKVIPALKQPVLGICLGLQLLCNHSQENDTKCFGLFDAQVLKFPPREKVPHMGWNTIEALNSPLFTGVNDNSFVYFVHSYYAEIVQYTVAQTDYIVPFSAAIQKDNFFAVQFHPEKSGTVGEKILTNFINL
jgi:glutamine amidotransferase